jgi:NAD(P)-dependent dehydrogenase (short-subunit alcohol dehydrogenase family)
LRREFPRFVLFAHRTWLVLTQQQIFDCTHSGIGLEAAKLLALMNPIHRIVLVARTLQKAKAAKEAIMALFESTEKALVTENLIPMECDHCSLSSVRTFITELRRELDESYNSSKWAENGIDGLCLNAGVLQPPDSEPAFTEDGIEMMFQTNHLAPWLIASQTIDLINPKGRVVFSVSGLFLRHQLKFDGMLDNNNDGTPRKWFRTMDGTDYDFKKAYSLSKLCNMAVCMELNERLRPKDATSTCFSPGLMTTSPLHRNQPRSSRDIITTIHLAPEVIHKLEKTVLWGAGALVYMVTAEASGNQGGQFWSDRTCPIGSAAVYGKEFCPTYVPNDHIRQEQRETLWKLSCHLAGIHSDPLFELS